MRGPVSYSRSTLPCRKRCIWRSRVCDHRSSCTTRDKTRRSADIQNKVCSSVHLSQTRQIPFTGDSKGLRKLDALSVPALEVFSDPQEFAPRCCEPWSRGEGGSRSAQFRLIGPPCEGARLRCPTGRFHRLPVSLADRCNANRRLQDKHNFPATREPVPTPSRSPIVLFPEKDGTSRRLPKQQWSSSPGDEQRTQALRSRRSASSPADGKAVALTEPIIWFPATSAEIMARLNSRPLLFVIDLPIIFAPFGAAPISVKHDWMLSY
jgi:hypothetical protein